MATGEHKRKPIYVICSNCGKEFSAFTKNARYCPECKKIIHRQEQARYKANMRMRESDVPEVPADDYDTLAEKIKKTAPIETCLVQHKEDNMDNDRAERLKAFPSMSNRLEHPEYFTGDTPESLGQTKTVPDDNGTTVDISPDEKEAFDTLKKAHGSLLEEITSDKKRMLLALYDGMSDMCMASGMTFAEMLDRMSRLHAALS